MHYIFVILFMVVGLTSLHSGAEAAPEAAAAPGHDDSSLRAVQEGHELAQRRQYAEALAAYQRAAEGARDGWPMYFAGCAQRSLGQLDEALASFQRAAELGSEGDQGLHGRALMNIAWVQEARGDLVAARAAWQGYIAFAEANTALGPYVANARQRLESVAAVQDLAAAYVEVRQRIAAEPPASSSN